LANTNDLGIQEVIGFGESWYDHSIPGRIDNVALTASRINNHIVKPGQEFLSIKLWAKYQTKLAIKMPTLLKVAKPNSLLGVAFAR
jgi:hypothetical protein